MSRVALHDATLIQTETKGHERRRVGTVQSVKRDWQYLGGTWCCPDWRPPITGRKRTRGGEGSCRGGCAGTPLRCYLAGLFAEAEERSVGAGNATPLPSMRFSSWSPHNLLGFGSIMVGAGGGNPRPVELSPTAEPKLGGSRGFLGLGSACLGQMSLVASFHLGLCLETSQTKVLVFPWLLGVRRNVHGARWAVLGRQGGEAYPRALLILGSWQGSRGVGGWARGGVDAIQLIESGARTGRHSV